MIIIARTKTTLMNRIEVVAKDGSKYFYITAPYNVKNPLGVVRATLKEYAVYAARDSENIIVKLYKTDTGNWFDLPGGASFDSLVSTYIKMAIDKSES